MKQKILLLLGSLSLAVAGSAVAASGGDSHAHGHEHAGAATLQLDAGRKWPTDTPLRQSMGAIRVAMSAALPDIHAKRLPEKEYAVLAQQIDSEIGNVVANCKLDARADAQLHLVLAELIAGTEKMAGKAKSGKARDGAIQVVGALGKYGKYFDDPEFKPIRH